MKTWSRVSIFIVLISIIGCKKKEKEDPPPVPIVAKPTPNYPAFNRVQLLKVDYLTYAFEGGTQILLSSVVEGAQSLPIKVTYKAPADFGSVLLQTENTSDTLFSGSIIWMGKGEIFFPNKFEPDSTFAHTFGGNQHEVSDYVPIPLYQGHQAPAPDLAKTWNAIGNLQIVSSNKALGQKFLVLLYTPSVGAGDPADWDWIFLFSI